MGLAVEAKPWLRRGACALLLVLAACTGDGQSAGQRTQPIRAERDGTPSTAPPTTAPRRASVAILGDSITRMSEPAIAARMAAGFGVSVNAVDGATIAEQTDTGGLFAAAQPDVLIVELGTNDAVRENPLALTDLHRLATAVADVPCVVWYTVLSYPNRAGIFGRAINAELEAMADANPNFHVTDWNRVALTWDGLLDAHDGVHPNADGQRLLADLYARDVTTACGHPPVAAIDAPADQPLE